MSHKNKPTSSTPNTLTWLLPSALAVGAGVLFVLAFSLLFPQLMRCAPLNEAPSWAFQTIVTLLSAGLPTLFSQILGKNIFNRQKLSQALPSLTLAAALFTALFFRFVLAPPEETICHPELKTMHQLIEAEGNATLHADLEGILAIYDPNAIIHNVASGEQWANPATYYSLKFQTEVHCSIMHSQRQTIRLTSQEAIIATASAGTWGKKAANQGCTEIYNSPPMADYWYFRKTGQEWKISGFRFNCHTNPAQCP